VLTLVEIERYLDELEEKYSHIVKLQSIGKSSGGRNIKAVLITDNDISESDKEVAIVMGLRHGDEIGVVPAVIKVLDWLVSDDGKITRERQKVIVIPVVNPDGFIKQEFGAPREVISKDEEEIIVPFILAQEADMVLDVHSLDRGDIEAIITGHTLHEGEDDFIHGFAAAKMLAGAADHGYPYVLHMLGIQSRTPWHSTPRMAGYESSTYNNWVCAPVYEKMHTLVLGMEVNSYSLNEEECGKSGLAAIRPLIKLGNIRSPWECTAGYPNRIIKGNMHISLRATGSNAEEYRKSRIELWQKREYFTEPVRLLPTLTQIKAKTKFSGEKLSSPFALCCRLHGNPEIKQVTLNRKVCDYRASSDNCSTFVFVDVQSAKTGVYEITIDI